MASAIENGYKVGMLIWSSYTRSRDSMPSLLT